MSLKIRRRKARVKVDPLELDLVSFTRFKLRGLRIGHRRLLQQLEHAHEGSDAEERIRTELKENELDQIHLKGRLNDWGFAS